MIQDYTASYASSQFLHNSGSDNIAYLIIYQISVVVGSTAGGVSVTFTWDDGTAGSPRSNNIGYGTAGGPASTPQDNQFIVVMAPGTDLSLDYTMVGTADGTYRVAVTYAQIV